MTLVSKPKAPNPGAQANLLQMRAADPYTSAWVAASAGSGKTKVLIDRLVRLLLSGAEPNRIVCLTYTNAAAAEMTNRLYLRLNEFTHGSDEDLRTQLRGLNGNEPRAEDVKKARELLRIVLDSPGGVRVDTIHGFSQMVLTRFPLEAGLTPGFEVADEHTSKNLMGQAIQELLASDKKEVSETLTYLLQEFPSETVEDFVRDLMGLTWRSWLSQLPDDFTAPDLGEESKPLPQGLTHLLRQLVELCNQTDVTDDHCVDACAKVLEINNDLGSAVDTLYPHLYTQAGAMRSRVLKASTLKKVPEALSLATKIAAAVDGERELQKAKHAHKIAQALTFLAVQAERLYSQLKRQDGVLDYDDLIYHTVQLFTNAEMAPWVLYKLDGGIDHLLLDEAQDTSHQQWRLITSLLEEFFSGANEDRHRTLFVVGDVKQSIYGFQGADPHGFVHNREQFRMLFDQSRQRWQDVPLNISFRSAPAVLRAVDTVFARNDLASRLGERAAITHIPFRQNTMGRVEVWPLSEAPESENPDFTAWESVKHPFTHVTESSDVLAEEIAVKIRDWLAKGKYLSSQGRSVKPKDIMILVQRRSLFVTRLVSKLREHNVPVEGEDRYDLCDHLLVRDILNLFAFCCLPEDDLALACVLKSPFCGLSDDDLLMVRQCAGESLWCQLQKSEFKSIINWLGDVCAYSTTKRPFDVLMYVLYHQGGLTKLRTRFGEVASDVCADLTGLIEQFEVSEVPTLSRFLFWFQHTNTLVSRGKSGHIKGVRIMTVHGSKGLQAPIVILPDTVRVPSEVPALSLNDKRDLVYMPSSKNRPQALQGAYESAFGEMIDEYYRLLYVAMTRAEDELIVCGWKSKRAVNYEHSWYHVIHSSLAASNESIEPIILGDEEDFGHVLKVLPAQAPDVSPCFKALPAVEAPSPRLLSPTSLTRSLFEVKAPPKNLPQASQTKEQGIKIHRLFELWGSLDENTKQSFPQEERDLVAKTIANPHFKRFFAEASYTEVELRGIVHEKPMRAILDRVGVDEDGVWFLDYKTTKNVVADVKILPDYMLAQMGCYALLLEKLYPQKPVQGFVLWTSNQSLTEIPLEKAKEVFSQLVMANEIPQVPEDDPHDEIAEGV